MPEQPLPGPQGPADVRGKLHELSRLLRRADHLDPDAQRELADLVDELADSLNPAALQSAEGSHLADSTAHLARALNRPHDTGLLASAKKRLEESIIRAENEVPLASGLARNLLDILANLGI